MTMDNDPDTYSWTYTPEDEDYPVFPAITVMAVIGLICFFATVGALTALWAVVSWIGG